MESEEHELANISPIRRDNPPNSSARHNHSNSSRIEQPVRKNPASGLLAKRASRAQFKVPWTEDEVETLKSGIELYGVGRWIDILNYGSRRFNPKRTSVDLKDKYRVLLRNNQLR